MESQAFTKKWWVASNKPNLFIGLLEGIPTVHIRQDSHARRPALQNRNVICPLVKIGAAGGIWTHGGFLDGLKVRCGQPGYANDSTKIVFRFCIMSVLLTSSVAAGGWESNPFTPPYDVFYFGHYTHRKSEITIPPICLMSSPTRRHFGKSVWPDPLTNDRVRLLFGGHPEFHPYSDSPIDEHNTSHRGIRLSYQDQLVLRLS